MQVQLRLYQYRYSCVVCVNSYFDWKSQCDTAIQGCNARKVISEVYTSFLLQCTVSGR